MFAMSAWSRRPPAPPSNGPGGGPSPVVASAVLSGQLPQNRNTKVSLPVTYRSVF